MLLKSAKQRKTEKVYKSFEQISDDYDAINDITSLGMHRVWKMRVAEEIKKKQFHKILDVCCGTGDMAFLLANQKFPVEITGVDFSGQMLEMANRRKAKKQITNVTFEKHNVEHLPYKSGQFDCVVLAFGLRSLADRKTALRELNRVLRPGGMIYCLETYTPESEKAKPVYETYRKQVIPVVTAALAGKGIEYRRIAQSGDDFLSKKQLVHLLQKSGFSKVGYYSHVAGVAACHRGMKPE